MQTDKRCYYVIISRSMSEPRVRFGFARRAGALIDVSMERWTVLSHRLREDGFRIVRCRIADVFSTEP